MTEKTIQWLLAQAYRSPFYARRQLVVVPNVSWGFDLSWEADLLVCSKSGYITEIEIKISMSDWKADLHKQKHYQLAVPVHTNKIKKFYYACPRALAIRHAEISLPPVAGVIACDADTVEIIKPAEEIACRKINDKEKFVLMRLAALKAWDIESRKPVNF